MRTPSFGYIILQSNAQISDGEMYLSTADLFRAMRYVTDEALIYRLDFIAGTLADVTEEMSVAWMNEGDGRICLADARMAGEAPPWFCAVGLGDVRAVGKLIGEMV